MRILLTGATGYLGSNIAHALEDDGHEVTCIVRKESCTEGLKSYRLIMNNLDEIDEELSCRKYDWVINTACVYRQNASLYGDMINANLVFPSQLLNLAVKNHISNFMTMGTSLPDTFNMYSFTKSGLSKIGKYISDHEGMINFADMKLEMFYGSYHKGGNNIVYDRFIHNIAHKLLLGESIQLTNGTQKRDIIHVFDAVNIILRVLRMNLKGFRKFPVGTGENHSIREIAEFLHSYMNSSSHIEFGAVPQREGEPDTLADVKWYDEIGYKLKYSFFEGLKDECEKIKKENRKDVMNL